MAPPTSAALNDNPTAVLTMTCTVWEFAAAPSIETVTAPFAPLPITAEPAIRSP